MRRVNLKCYRAWMLLVTLCFVGISAFAERVSVDKARKVALSVAKQLVPNTKSALALDLVYTACPNAVSTKKAGDADFFVFNFSGNSGFVIVAGEDRVRPVLGYSSEGAFSVENLPVNMRGWLNGYQEEIAFAVQHDIQQTAAVQSEWNSYSNGVVADNAADGVLIETALWDQEDPYNRLCPMKNDERTLTGCVATAMAIVMKYHQWPDKAVKGVSNYMGKKVNYGNYDWSKMPMQFVRPFNEDEATAISELLWNIGANVKMQYGTFKEGGSAAYSTDAATAFHKVFQYSKQTRYLNKAYYSDLHWKTMLKDELDAKRPVFYDGGNDKSGHAFVCDGYKGDKFHFNWGWSGGHNGYFLLSALDPLGPSESFSPRQGCIFVKKPVANENYVTEISLLNHLQSVKPTVGVSFNVSAQFFNSGNTTFNGKVAIGLVDVNNYRLKDIVSEERLDTIPPRYGYYNGAVRFKTLIQKPLGEDERLMLVYKQGKSLNWEPVRSSAFKDRVGVNGAEFDDGSSLPGITYCAVMAELKNMTVVLPEKIRKGETLSVTLVADEGYQLPSSVSVQMGNLELPASRYAYNKSNGELSIENVVGDVIISAEGVKGEVANINVEKEKVRFCVVDGVLQILSTKEVKVSVYNFFGNCLFKGLCNGSKELLLSKGAYVLEIDGQRFKIVF